MSKPNSGNRYLVVFGICMVLIFPLQFLLVDLVTGYYLKHASTQLFRVRTRLDLLVAVIVGWLLCVAGLAFSLISYLRLIDKTRYRKPPYL